MAIKELIKNILRAGLKNEKIDIEEYATDENFMRIMREQTFQAWLYYVCPILEYKKYYIGSVLIHSQFDDMAKLIKETFEKEGIDYIFLKGYVLQNLYPDRNLRMLGDIDVLVRSSDYKKAKQALAKNEFKLLDEQDHHTGLSLGQIEAEVHHKLINTGDWFHDFFEDGFKYAHIKNGHEYELDKNYNFLFLLAHYLKHLKQGAGLRELIDIYLILEKEEIDISQVRTWLKEHNAEKFLDLILHEIDVLFGYNKIPYEKNDYVEEIIDYSICSGIHGFGDDNRWIATRMNNTSKTKFGFLMKTLFIPVKSLFNLYPWTKSIILIPFGYIARFFFLLTKRRSRLKQVMRADLKKDQMTIYEKIGIDLKSIK